jgi:hypothetical protein
VLNSPELFRNVLTFSSYDELTHSIVVCCNPYSYVGIQYQWLRFESGPKVFGGLFFYCKFECGWGLEKTPLKRHGLIQLRSIKNVDSGIVSMNYEHHL